MKIVVTCKKPVLTAEGRLPMDTPIDVSPQLAAFLIERGEAVAYETKLAQERPLADAGAEPLSSASPAAQVSTPTTLPPSNDGAKRRGRPPKQ